ncbi:MAG: hypothetical protein EOP33_01575 [Rickettsiaceae bacterium]|nr:MAG: hypothetical protein EOP33_01575 [Rickettsiaceae bacterium]
MLDKNFGIVLNFGSGTFENQTFATYQLNAFIIIKQLRSLKDVNFTPCNYGRNYIDWISEIYNQSTIDEDAALLLPNLRSILKKIISDVNTKEIFKNLGTTDLDIALIQGDIEVIKSYAANNKLTDPFNMAREWRMLNIAKDIVMQDTLMPNPFSDIELNIGDNSILLEILQYQAFNYQKSDFSSKNMLIDIHDQGLHSWGYNVALKWHNALAPFFDKVVTFGNGSNCIINFDIVKLLNFHEVKDSKAPKLDFALVVLHNHSDKDSPKIAEQLPSNIAKETVYLVNSCYSGKYHTNWSGNAHLITSSSIDEFSSIRDFNKIFNLSSFWQSDHPTLKGLLQFCADQYKFSTPHYTGSISGMNFANSPVKDVVTALWSNEHESTAIETSIATSEDVIEVQFTGLTNLLMTE